MAKSNKTQAAEETRENGNDGVAAIVRTLQESAAQTVHQMVLLINPAPYIREDAVEDGEQHRGNTPWTVIIPSLGISLPVLDDTGEPRMGYLPHSDGVDFARRVWNQCRDNPDLIDELRAQNVYPADTVTGFDPDTKIMYRMMEVEPIDS